MRLVDPPSEITVPDYWPGLTLLATTAYLEAEGEPESGQLAVAYNPCNRARYQGWELHKAILGPDGKAYDDGRPYETYSAWNDDYRQQAYNRISNLTTVEWEHFYRLACAAYWQFLPDPSHGAFFYLNPELTRKIRGDGTLPPFWDIDGDPMSEVAIGQHRFRRHR